MSSISNTIRDTAKDAKDAGREAGQAASAGARDIQAALVGLRDDVARLTHKITYIFTTKGTASWQRANWDLDGVISDAGEKGREAIGAVQDVGGNVVDAVHKSLKQRPYTALAVAVGLGFLFGVDPGDVGRFGARNRCCWNRIFVQGTGSPVHTQCVQACYSS